MQGYVTVISLMMVDIVEMVAMKASTMVTRIVMTIIIFMLICLNVLFLIVNMYLFYLRSQFKIISLSYTSHDLGNDLNKYNDHIYNPETHFRNNYMHIQIFVI